MVFHKLARWGRLARAGGTSGNGRERRMKRIHPNNADGFSGSLTTARYGARGVPSQEDLDRAAKFRELHEAMTPAKLTVRSWRHSAKLRKRKHPVTLPTVPFDHRGDA